MPKLSISILRYLEMFILGFFILSWLIIWNKTQILIAQGPYEGIVAVIAKKIFSMFRIKIIVVVESHGDFEESLFLQRKVMFSKIYRLLMRWTAKYALKYADLLRAISKSTSQQLKSWAPEKTLFQFPTWTDIDVFFEASSHPVEDNRHEVLYAGVLILRKGIHHLIDAFSSISSKFPEARLLIVGKPENREYAEKLKTLVNRHRLNGCITFIGELSQKELAHLMRRSCVFVIPSLSEGLGRVVFEAMACGTPVIGSRVGGIPEMVKDEITGFLVPPGDEKALADRLRWMFAHPEETKAMGKRAFETAREIFSAEVYVQNYAQLFEAAQQMLKSNGHVL